MAGPVPSLSRPLLPQEGTGWPLLPTPDGNGALRWPDLDASVRQTLEAILRTTPGERLMRPRFGAGLEALVHRPNTLETRAAVHAAIMKAARLYEPRILLDRVEVEAAEDPRVLRISLAYRLRSTGEPRRLEASAPVGGA